MIVLTVKTLDSQNHTFTVDDDITVEEFKAKIADTVNIPAETQRIIYCGRVLQDDVKLSDYDVHGKVVHLVERPPPGANPPTTRSSSPQPSRRNASGGGGGFRGFESGGNTVYLGSMAFPSNLMESQGIVPPPPTHSLAGSRLNVARRMLRRADAVITLLENPSARPCDIVNPDEQQDEEVTPIIEARVIVPPGNNEHIDEAMVISAVQNSLFDSGALPVGSQVTVDSNTGATTENNTGSSTPEETGNTNDTTQNERGSGANNGRPLAENASRTSEMADLLTMLNQLQTRFAPFLERYHQFMVEDPVVSSENVRQTQVMLSRVSEVLHFLGHAYHSLSDIIIRVRTPPPRPLLCRPILIQHSAVVQTGIPIQVEAQFNLSTDRSNTTSSPASTNNTTTTTTATTAAAVTTTTTPSTTSTTNSGNTSNTLPNAHQQPFVNVRSIPLIPAASMRVQSFPIELRTTARPIGVNILQRNNNNNSGNSENITSSSSSTTTTITNSGTTNTTTTTSSSAAENSGFQLPNFNNSSVEFFMEVTPEGTLNGPPPEFLQSLVQMAGQIMNRVTTTTAATATTTTGTTTSSTTAASTSVSGDSSQTPGQNSQARGNTQTHPTTSTHTRSTSRPHVHLAQQAMQGGFDPFLPCNSHHITHRRRQHPQQQQQQQQQPQQQVFNLRDGLQAIRNFMSSTGVAASAGSATRTTTTTNTAAEEQRRNNTSGGSENNRQDGNVPNAQIRMDEIYSALRNAFRQRGQNDPRRVVIGDNINASMGQTSNENRENATQNIRASFTAGLPPNLQNLFTSLPNVLQGPTIAEILQQLPPDDSTIRPGESMITDLIMLLSRNLTLLDMITLNSGNVEPLNRVSNDIQQFFMTRVLDGSTSQEAVNRGVDRLINEMQPFFQNFGRLRVRDDIDIVRSVEQLFRRRLPDIIATAGNLNSGNMRDLVNHCLNLAKLTCRLTLHASANGLQGVEDTFQQIVTSYMQGIPAELQNWTLMTSCANLRHFMSNLGSPEVESYIIRNSDMPSEPETQQNETRSETVPPPPPPSTTTTATVEPMELDMEIEISEPVASPEEELEDPEPLPNVVIGSEPWHNQVPEDWVPIITRDVQRQRRQNPQGPFSDAYLSGMPTKRRKIVNSSKPQGSLPQVISESVRRAITTTGLASVAPLEVVAQAAGNCVDVQSAYRSLLRTTVQTALRDNEDFTPERFPNAATYFKTP